MASTETLFGRSVGRVEDARLITGEARYIADLVHPGMAHLAVVRSPIAHARLLGIDTAAAAAMPGVVAVLTGEDMRAAGFGPIQCAWRIPNADLRVPEWPPLALGKVRYVGEAVAAVVADDPYTARDAALAVELDLDVLPAVTGSREAVEDSPAVLHDSVPGNLAFEWTLTGGDVGKAFRDADVVVADTIVNQRVIPSPMEPRGVVATWNRADGSLELWISSQNPHIVRALLAAETGIPEHKIRVVTPEIGGAFGSKIAHYPEDSVVAFAAMRTDRPVRWIESRSEHCHATTHGRDMVQEVELAATRDGRILGLRARAWANMGAYLSTTAPGVPTILHSLMLSGVYEIGAVEEKVYGALTNTTPTDAYRGAGRPEATFLVERMVNLLARELGRDPVDVRRANLIPPFTDGHRVITGVTYDTGNYEAALDKALGLADYASLRERQRELRAQGRFLGIGVSTYVESCGSGPSSIAGMGGFFGGQWESAVLRFYPSGVANVFVGINPHGQGQGTTFAQLVADGFGIPLGDVEIVHGDTAATPMGWGTYGSRGTAVGGGAVFAAITKLQEKGRRIAAHMLEVAEDDLELSGGAYAVRGSRQRRVTIQEVVHAANAGWSLPEGVEPGFEASGFFDPPNYVHPFGCHVAVVEVNAETGEISLERYVAVDDCGRVINPMIVEGQVHGGLAQGIGQALWEGALYDEDGNLITSSFMEYALPKAEFLPPFELERTETPSTSNPLGVKGVGETGAIGSTPAVYEAVMDALAPLGVRRIEMPLTPERVWRAIGKAKGDGVAAGAV